ncbi:MAG: helix-turn-helix transcriptional regulator, partial [Coriobacteriales bacterium]|nr:helix-turn-helix transcriptional regulator [Coriobacteriales bacterium]
ISVLLGYFLLPREKDIHEMSVLEADTAAAVADAVESARGGRFIQRCQQAANNYLLSSRELDVLFLLAKGRNASYIAKNLFISEGTVHTHTWRIYRKMNVHTQQELMNLVESQELHDEPLLSVAAAEPKPAKASKRA